MLSRCSPKALKLIFWEEESRKTIKDMLTDDTLEACGDFFIVVGPEGGFSKDEIEKQKRPGSFPSAWADKS